jgi:hypothetical protein
MGLPWELHTVPADQRSGRAARMQAARFDYKEARGAHFRRIVPAPAPASAARHSRRRIGWQGPHDRRPDAFTRERPIAPGKGWCPLPPWDPTFPGAFFCAGAFVPRQNTATLARSASEGSARVGQNSLACASGWCLGGTASFKTSMASRVGVPLVVSVSKIGEYTKYSHLTSGRRGRTAPSIP